MAVARLTLDSSAPRERQRLSDEVELYQRTYTTLLRSSGETRLRVLEPSHRAMGSSLHPLAGQRRARPRRVPVRDPAPARRRSRRARDRHGPGRRGLRRAPGIARSRTGTRPRRPRGGGAGTTAAPGRSPCCWPAPPTSTTSIPTLVAYQIEWNKLRVRQRAAGWPRRRTASRRPRTARASSAARDEDWARLREAWGERFAERLRRIARDAADPAHPHARRLAAPATRASPAAGGRRCARELDRPGAGRRADVLRLLQHRTRS